MEEITPPAEVHEPLFTLRRKYLHTLDTPAVHNFLEKLIFSPDFDLYTDLTINALKYVSRRHGLPAVIAPMLLQILLPPKDDNAIESTDEFKYKASLALKSAVVRNPNITSLKSLLTILSKSFPVETLSQGIESSAMNIHFKLETMSQVCLCICAILNPDRVATEKISRRRLFVLQEYVPYVTANHKSEVRRTLERMGYWSGVSLPEYLSQNRFGSSPTGLVQGAQLLQGIQRRRGCRFSRHAVRTLQTEAVTTEENLSEKTQIASISLSQALDRRRTRAMEAAREREALPPAKSTSKSDSCWWKWAGFEVPDFLEKAKGHGAISPGDVKALRRMFDGFKISLPKNDKRISEMIAEIFYLISRYQVLDNAEVHKLLKTSFKKEYESTRLHVVQAVDRHCTRLGKVPEDIDDTLRDLSQGPGLTNELKNIIAEILFSDDSQLEANLDSSIRMLSSETECDTALRYIRRHLLKASSLNEVRAREDTIAQGLLQALISVQQTALLSNVLEVLEDFLQLRWTPPIPPSEILSLIQLANVNPEIRSTASRCILRAMEKVFQTPADIDGFSEEQLSTTVRFLFSLTTVSEDKQLAILTIGLLSQNVELEAVRQVIWQEAREEHVRRLREQLLRKDVLLEDGTFIQQEELTEEFFNGFDTPDREYGFAATYVSKFLLNLLRGGCPSTQDEVTISIVSEVLILPPHEKLKMTKILCSEYLFECAKLPHVPSFSVPVLHRLQGMAFSCTLDIRIYSTAALCLSLAKLDHQTLRSMSAEHVNFLVSLYSFSRLTIGDTDFTLFINPEILKVFSVAALASMDLSEEVFQLLALILNRSCVDSESSPDFEAVQMTLKVIASYCELKAYYLAPCVLEAVQQLMPQCDLFVEPCATILEQCMLAGRWISQWALETFAKYLDSEPEVSIPFLRRLALANENQELSDPMFVVFQIDLIALRLFQRRPEVGQRVLDMFGFGGVPEAEAFSCLMEYVNNGRPLSRMALQAIQGLLEAGRVPMENICLCLTAALSNGQNLPSEVIIPSLCILDEDGSLFERQLELATALIKRNQVIPEGYLRHVYNRFDGYARSFQWVAGWKSVLLRIMTLLRTLIQQNKNVPRHTLAAYCKYIWDNKVTMTTADYLNSLLKLIASLDEVDITADANKELFHTCKNLLRFAAGKENETLSDIGRKGMEMLSDPIEPPAAALLAEGLWRRIQTSARSTTGSSDWREMWDHPSRVSLETAVLSDTSLLNEIKALLLSHNNARTPFDEFLLETICLTWGNPQATDECRQVCQAIVENVQERRQYALNGICQFYLRNVQGVTEPDNLATAVRTALADWRQKQSSRRTETLKSLMRDNYQICLSISMEILAVIESKYEDLSWRQLPHMGAIISQAVVDGHCSGESGRLERYADIIEREIMSGPRRTLSLALEAYAKVLESHNSPQTKDCVRFLAQALGVPHGTHTNEEKHLAFVVFTTCAQRTGQLPPEVLSLVQDCLVSGRDLILRAECFQLVTRVKDELQGEWTDTWSQTLNVMTSLPGSFQNDIQLNEENMCLLQTLQTVFAAPVEALHELPRDQWVHHLLVTDTIDTLSSSLHDKVKVHPHAVKLSRCFLEDPIARLYIVKGIETLARESSNLSPVSALRLVLHALCSPGMGPTTIPYWRHNWASEMVEFGLSAAFQGKLNTVPGLIPAILKDFLQNNSISPEILISLADLISTDEEEDDCFLEFRRLLELIRSRRNDSALIHRILRRMQIEEETVSLSRLLPALEKELLLSRLPQRHKNLSRQLRRQVEKLISRNYKYQELDALFTLVETAAEENVYNDIGLSAWDTLENVLYQLMAYKIRCSQFNHILGVLQEAPVSDWIGLCNGIVMSHIYSRPDGVKEARTIATEYAENNYLSGEDTSRLEDFFSEMVGKVQTGNLSSTIMQDMWNETTTELPNKLIKDWSKTDIWQWAKLAESRKADIDWTSLEFLTEYVSIVSRCCVIQRRYRHLTAIQILSLYVTLASDSEQGRLLQVSTGSGKSTIIPAVAVFHCLQGVSVDIHTSSPVLAARDSRDWASFYHLFTLTCDHNGDRGSCYKSGEKACYKKNIVYGDTSQFQFDALRHEYSGLGTRASRKYGYAIVDEVDFMLMDDSSKLARLSTTLPGMDLLHILYHLIWHRLYDIKNRLYGVAGCTFYLDGKRSHDESGNLYYTFHRNGRDVTLDDLGHFIRQNMDDSEELASAFIYRVHDADDFVTVHLEQYTKALLGDYTFPTTSQQRAPVTPLKLPKVLLSFARTQVNNWVDAALTAVAFQQDFHYVVDHDQIKPVDYQSTGIIQTFTNWNNGLHQFLQLKHSLRLQSETVTTNFLSNMAMFQKYSGRLVGFSGTLGHAHSQEMLNRIYGVETVIIPDLYHSRFHPLDCLVLPEAEWLDAVYHAALHEASKGRAVLLICQTIREAHLIGGRLEQAVLHRKQPPMSVKLYTKNDENQESLTEKVEPGDIIVATNLAGRGTDINAERVEENGGLHVILTFLTDSFRVQQQGFGRTGRQGRKGTGQMIIASTTSLTPEELLENRDRAERERLRSFEEGELNLIRTKDKLFSQFSRLFSRIRTVFENNTRLFSTEKIKSMLGKKTLSGPDKVRLQAIEQLWAIFLKRIDDGEIEVNEAAPKYAEFEERIESIFMDTDTLIRETENAFYFVHLGNHEYSEKLDREASLQYDKAIQLDPNFVAGSYAGSACSMLRGKNSWLGDASGSFKYKKKALASLLKARKIACKEMSFCSVAQTLLSQRGGRSESELYKQLTERANLLGDYHNNLEAIVGVVERSLRRVYATNLSANGVGRKWRLDDETPVDDIDKYGSFGGFSLTFHDLTFQWDMGRQDQATDTLGKHSEVSFELKNENLETLSKELKKIVGSCSVVELRNVGSLEKLQRLLQAMQPSTFKVVVALEERSHLGVIETSEEDEIVRVCWTNEVSPVELRKSIAFKDVAQEVPEATAFTLAFDFASGDEVNILTRFFQNEKAKISVKLRDVGFDVINGNWSVSTTDPSGATTTSAGLLQEFNQNTVILTLNNNKKAKKVIEICRESHIDFVMTLTALSFEEARTVLTSSNRKQEHLNQTQLRQLGYQYSSSFIPLETITELCARGMGPLVVFAEMAPLPWRSMLSVGLVGTVQVVAGAALICTGFGAKFGLSLVTEGMSDYYVVYRASASRQFSWKQYGVQKALSVMITVATMGTGAFKDAAIGVKELVKGGAKEVTEQAGVRLIMASGKFVGKEIAASNLCSLALKQVATKAIETGTRAALNTAIDSVARFTFESVRENIKQELDRTVSRICRSPEFHGAYSTCAAMDHLKQQLPGRVEVWLTEVTSPQSLTWNSVWDSVGFPLCNGILSDSQYLGSGFSIIVRLVGIINGSHEIFTVAKKVCQHIHVKLRSECNVFTPTYIIQEKFGVVPDVAQRIANVMEFSQEPDKPFKVTRLPTEDGLRAIYSEISVAQLEQHFQALHQRKKSHSRESENFSRLVGSIVEMLTSHIIHVADRQLVSPLTTLAVGTIVAKISQEIQSHGLINPNELSKDQRRMLELKKMSPDKLTDDDKAFLKAHDRPLTFAEQIRGNAKDYMIAYQRRDVIAMVKTITPEEKKAALPDTLGPLETECVLNILDDKPADMTTVFMLAELNDANVKLVEDPNYQKTEDDEKNGVRVVLWERSTNGEAGGRYVLLDEGGNRSKNDGVYDIFASITGKSEMNLRRQLAVYITQNQSKFARINEGANWIRDRYPREAATLLNTEHNIIRKATVISETVTDAPKKTESSNSKSKANLKSSSRNDKPSQSKDTLSGSSDQKRDKKKGGEGHTPVSQLQGVTSSQDATAANNPGDSRIRQGGMALRDTLLNMAMNEQNRLFRFGQDAFNAVQDLFRNMAGGGEVPATAPEDEDVVIAQANNGFKDGEVMAVPRHGRWGGNVGRALALNIVLLLALVLVLLPATFSVTLFLAVAICFIFYCRGRPR